MVNSQMKTVVLALTDSRPNSQVRPSNGRRIITEKNTFLYTKKRNKHSIIIMEYYILPKQLKISLISRFCGLLFSYFIHTSERSNKEEGVQLHRH